MTTWYRMTIRSTFLILLTAGISLASSGSVATSAAPAAQPAPPAGLAIPAPAAQNAPASIPAAPQAARPAVRGDWAIMPSRTARGMPAVLVIPAKEMDAATYGRVNEDLSVMTRIIEKSVASVPEVTGYYREAYLQVIRPDRNVLPVLQSFGGRPKPMYIGGYGVLFSLQVKFPLVPPPEQPKPDQTAQATDQVWDAAQRELTEPQNTLRSHHVGAVSEPYRPEAVESLKTALLAALKHAANIRDLEPESWLTVLVEGPSATVEQAPDASDELQDNLLIGTRPAGRTLLTLRAKKADIDQFAKGQVDPTQFQQRVQIVAQ